MKTKNKHRELLKLIVELVEHIAQINALPSGSRKLYDTIAFEDENGKYVAYQIVRESIGDEGSWVLASRDKQLWDQVVARLCDLNPEIISPQNVDKMLGNFTRQYLRKQWTLSGLPQDAEALINTIVNEKGRTARVFLPICGLLTKVSSFLIGEVAFRARTECPEIEDDLARFESARQLDKIHTIAITESYGDDYMLVQNAEAKINQALNIFRAFTQPTVQDPTFKQIGIMGTFYPSEKLYYVECSDISIDVLPKPLGGYTLSGIHDRTIDQYLTEYVLAGMGFDKMSNLLISPHSPFEAGLLRGAEWLGEATKPDTLESKFLKVAFAVDAMVGDMAEDIPDRGKKARIAERSAFLLANKPGERLRIYKEMRDFISKRDNLAHGSKQQVSKWETERFGTHARGLLRALLQHDQNFKTANELAEWVLLRSLNSGSQLNTGA